MVFKKRNFKLNFNQNLTKFLNFCTMMAVDTTNNSFKIKLAQNFSNLKLHITYESRLKLQPLFISYLIRVFTATRKLF